MSPLAKTVAKGDVRTLNAKSAKPSLELYIATTCSSGGRSCHLEKPLILNFALNSCVKFNCRVNTHC